MCLLNDTWDAVTATMIQNCWRKTGILPCNTTVMLETVESTIAEVEIVKNTVTEVETIIEEAAKLLTNLNLAICSCHGSHHLLATPHLVENIEELLREPPEPEWPEEDADETAVLDLVCTPLLQLCYGC